MCHEDWDGPGDGAEAAGAEIGIAVADGALPATLYEPAGDVATAGPCVLVPDIYGTVPFYHELSARLAARGHPTALIDIFWREGPLAEVTRDAAFGRLARMDAPRAIADSAAALDEMKAHSGADRIGVLGFCLGGLYGFVLAAHRDDLVVVSYYGFPEGVSAPIGVPAPRPVDLVDRMTGPILSFWGEDDYIGVDVMTRFGEALARNGVDYEAHVYPDAGHGFLQGLVEERPDSAAAADSWRRTLDLLETGLGG